MLLNSTPIVAPLRSTLPLKGRVEVPLLHLGDDVADAAPGQPDRPRGALR